MPILQAAKPTRLHNQGLQPGFKVPKNAGIKLLFEEAAFESERTQRRAWWRAVAARGLGAPGPCAAVLLLALGFALQPSAWRHTCPDVTPPSSTCRQRQGLRLPELLQSRATLAGLECIMFSKGVNEVASLPPFHVPHFNKRPEKLADLSALIAVPQACGTHWTCQSFSCQCAGPCALGLRRCNSFNLAACTHAWTSFRDWQMRRCAAGCNCGSQARPRSPVYTLRSNRSVAQGQKPHGKVSPIP